MVNDTLQEKDSKAAPVPHTLERTSGQPPKSLRDQEALSDNTHRHPAASDPLKDHHQQTGIPEAPASPPVWWCSPEKRLHNFQPPTADYSQEDIHDLVTEDEFMHALGLLTVKECEEVLAKRYERRKHTAYSHIFSATIWEKPETRRKRRAWLTSGAGSPPMLRRKVRPPSQPPSQPQSRPASPTQSSCSPMTTCPLSQPASPQSLEEEETPASQPSEEICPMCKVKGADVQCDGCGVIYHAQCVDLEDSEPPPCWLCLTCEQLGLRASSSHTDPHHLSRRREALAVRERLLRQRAELTIAKLQLEEKKHHLSLALQAQRAERVALQQREEDVREAIKQLQSFISTFQKLPTEPELPTQQNTSPDLPVPSSPASSLPGSSPQHSSFPGGAATSQPSSPSQSSLPSLSPVTPISLPTRAAPHATSPSLSCSSSSSSPSSSPLMPSVSLSQSSSPRQVTPYSFVLGGASQPSSPSPSPSPAHQHGVTISASQSPSPKPSHYSFDKHNVEPKSYIHSHHKRVRPPSHSRRDGELHALLPPDDEDVCDEPTDLSFPRQNRLSGIQRGESKVMAASS